LNLYHIQWKFRDEVRPRFGTMRSREFLMKDAYSFDLDEAGATQAFYRMFVAYLRTFHRMGLVGVPMRADAGPIGGDLSYEFHVLAETGESAVFLDKRLVDKPIPDIDTDFRGDLTSIFKDWTSLFAATDEMTDEAGFKAAVDPEYQLAARGIEVGHIFFFGTKYSKPMKATVTNQEGQAVEVQMGSYGIGPTRLVPAIIEASHDDAGIIWPVSVAPFEAVVINLKVGDAESDRASERLYDDLTREGIDVLLDDRDQGAGGKFAAADLIGIPYQLIVGPRGLKDGVVEIKHRKSGERETLSIEEAVGRLKSLIVPQRRDSV
jgi:prolyl-tRNA synthetase